MPQHLQILFLDKNIYLAIFRDISRPESIICFFIELQENKPTNKLYNLDDLRLVGVLGVLWILRINCINFENNNACGFSHQTLKTYEAAETNLKFQFWSLYCK